MHRFPPMCKILEERGTAPPTVGSRRVPPTLSALDPLAVFLAIRALTEMVVSNSLELCEAKSYTTKMIIFLSMT